jgi:hypothetical protein
MKRVYAFLVTVLTLISGATGCHYEEEYGVMPVDYDPNPTQDEDVEDADVEELDSDMQ